MRAVETVRSSVAASARMSANGRDGLLARGLRGAVPARLDATQRAGARTRRFRHAPATLSAAWRHALVFPISGNQLNLFPLGGRSH